MLTGRGDKCGPDGFDILESVWHRLGWIASDEGADNIDAKQAGGAKNMGKMVASRLCGVGIRVENVRVEAERRDRQPTLAKERANRRRSLGVKRLGWHVADAGIATLRTVVLRPGCQFQRLIAVSGREIGYFGQGRIGKGCSEKSEVQGALLSC